MHGNAGSEKRNKRTVSRASIVHLVQACGLGHLRRCLVLVSNFTRGPLRLCLTTLYEVQFCCAFFFFLLLFFFFFVFVLLGVLF